jgi:cation diffusion facilitator family transporter
MNSIQSNPEKNDPYKVAIMAARNVLFLNFALFVVKAITGWYGESFALIADAVNNLTDVGLSVGLYFGMKIASKPPDDIHAYGHGKVETEIGRIMGLVVLATAGGIIVAGFNRLNDVNPPPHFCVIAVAAISIGVKEYMYRYQRNLATRLSSQALAADALNHRTDVGATACVLLGTLVVLIGNSKYLFVDDLAAITVGVFMAFAAGRVVLKSTQELLDEMPPQEIIDRIKNAVLEVPGIEAT